MPISKFFHLFAGYDGFIRKMRRATIRYEISDLREFSLRRWRSRLVPIRFRCDLNRNINFLWSAHRCQCDYFGFRRIKYFVEIAGIRHNWLFSDAMACPGLPGGNQDFIMIHKQTIQGAV